MLSFKSFYLTVFTTVFLINSASAHYYDTLPKGVRLAAYRRVQTEEVKSTYNGSGSVENFQFNVNANTETLSGVNEALDTVFNEISNSKGGDYSFGSYNIAGSSKVSVDGMGFAYGFTDKLTGFVLSPTFNATTNVNFKQTKKGNGSSVSDNVCRNNGDDYSLMLCKAIQGVSHLVDNGKTLGEITQGILVNGLNYEHVGDWNGQGLGDIEFATLYRLYRDSQRGSAVMGGIALPTGRVDDPDILQDIGFGDGQFDLFGEIGGGHHLRKNWFINASTRYTYQFSGRREFRLPYNSAGLSDRKENIRFKLGNRITFNTNTEYLLNDWISLTFGYEMNKQGRSQFYSSDEKANDILAKGTDTVAHELYASGTISSITPFLKKNFLLPAKIGFMYRSTVGGKNTNKIDRIEVDFRMMF